MTTDLLQQQTQVGFNFPGSGYLPPGFIPTVRFPQRSIEVGKRAQAVHQMNQLQFNLAVPPSPDKLVTMFRRPQPIFIEKIKEQSQAQKLPASTTTPSIFPVALSVSSSMSSDRLALAVHLAKKDLKKVKEQGIGSVLALQEEESQNRHGSIAPKETRISAKKGKMKKLKFKAQTGEEKNSTTLRERVHRAVKKEDAVLKRKHEMVFYPAPGKDDGFESDGEKRQANEIRKLRKELHEYMKKMEELTKERPEILRNKDKRLKRRQEEDVQLSDEDFDKRQVARAEEQASRSARMLYVLQRQVREIEDELNKRGRGIRHTKKSQTLSRLAAAHRGAVRALQTFVSHAPLQPKVSHGLPPMYQELSALVRQLTLLAAQLHVGGGDDLIGEVKRIEQEEKVEGIRPKVDADSMQEKTSTAFIQEVAGTPPQRTEKLKPSLALQAITSSPEPTPERDAVLQAGLSALLRAKDTPQSTPMMNIRAEQKPAVPSVNPVKPAAPSVKPVKQSLLLPSKLKLKRQKAQQAAKRVKLPQAAVEQARFAQDTVSSILKKAPPGDGPDKHGTQTRTPPRTPTKEVPKSPGRIVHYRPQDMEHMDPSPRSPKYSGRMLAVERDILEKEIARQRWLDEEADRRLQELEELRRAENLRRNRMSADLVLSRRVVSETEEAIKSRLQPLLDRAQTIADLNTKRESDHKQSLQHQLGKLASDTAMNQADIVAEKILDDILEETVVEMQRLEADDEAAFEAEQLHNNTTLENLLQRLQAFEKIEEEIRRHWVHIKYSDVNSEPAVKNSVLKNPSLAKEPSPIVFTRSEHNTHYRVLSEKRRTSREHGRRKMESPSEQVDQFSEINSLSSVTEAGSSSCSSREYPAKSPHSRSLAVSGRPVVAISVPSEMRASVVSYRNKYNKYLRDTATHEDGAFDPWGLVNRISEDLLEDVLHDVGNELDHVCGDYAEALYNNEFAADNMEN